MAVHWAESKSSQYDVDIVDMEDIAAHDMIQYESDGKLEAYQIKRYLFDNYFDASSPRPFSHLLIIGNEDVVPLGHPDNWGLFDTDLSRFVGIEISGEILVTKNRGYSDYYKILCDDACQLRIGCLDDSDECSTATVSAYGTRSSGSYSLTDYEAKLYTDNLTSKTQDTWREFRLRLVNKNFSTRVLIKRANWRDIFGTVDENDITKDQIRIDVGDGVFETGKYNVRLVSLPTGKERYEAEDFADTSDLWMSHDDDLTLTADWNNIDGYMILNPPVEKPPFSLGDGRTYGAIHPFHWSHLLRHGDGYYSWDENGEGPAARPAFAVGRIPIGIDEEDLLIQILDDSIARQDLSRMNPAKERKHLAMEGWEEGVGNDSFSANALSTMFTLSRMTDSPGEAESIGLFHYLAHNMQPLRDGEFETYHNVYGPGIRDLIGDGIGFLLWSGHGIADYISEYLNTETINDLPADSISHVASLSCLTGAMGDTEYPTAAEVMIRSQVAGTVLAATQPITSLTNGTSRVEPLFKPWQLIANRGRRLTIGGAWFHMTTLFDPVKDSSVMADNRVWELLGDPTMPFVQGRDADLDGLENYSLASLRQTCDLHVPQQSFKDRTMNTEFEPWLVDACLDNCPFTPNSGEAIGADSTGGRSDGVGESCDNCPLTLNAWQDVDAYGIPLCGNAEQPVAYSFNVSLTCETDSTRALCIDLKDLPPVPVDQSVRIRYEASGTAGTTVRVRAVDTTISSDPLPTSDAWNGECLLDTTSKLCVHTLMVPSGDSYRLLIDVISPDAGEVTISKFKVMPLNYPIQFTSRAGLWIFASIEEWFGKTVFVNTSGTDTGGEIRGFAGVVRRAPNMSSSTAVIADIKKKDSIWCPEGNPNGIGVILPRLGFGGDIAHTLTFDLYTFVPPWFDPGYDVSIYASAQREAFQEAGLIRIYDSVDGTKARQDFLFSLSGDNPHKVTLALQRSDLAGIRDATVEFCIRGYGAYGIDNIQIHDNW